MFKKFIYITVEFMNFYQKRSLKCCWMYYRYVVWRACFSLLFFLFFEIIFLLYVPMLSEENHTRCSARILWRNLSFLLQSCRKGLCFKKLTFNKRCVCVSKSLLNYTYTTKKQTIKQHQQMKFNRHSNFLPPPKPPIQKNKIKFKESPFRIYCTHSHILCNVEVLN